MSAERTEFMIGPHQHAEMGTSLLLGVVVVDHLLQARGWIRQVSAGEKMDVGAHVARRKTVERHRRMKRTQIWNTLSPLYVNPISRT